MIVSTTQNFNILIDTRGHCIEHIFQIGDTGMSPEFIYVCVCACVCKCMSACVYINECARVCTVYNKFDQPTLQSQYRTESPCAGVASMLFFKDISLLPSLHSLAC